MYKLYCVQILSYKCVSSIMQIFLYEILSCGFQYENSIVYKFYHMQTLLFEFSYTNSIIWVLIHKFYCLSINIGLIYQIGKPF